MADKVSKSPIMSPTVKKEEEVYKAVTIQTAMEAVMTGATITKREWDNQEINCKLVNEKLMIKTDDGLFHPWIITLGDLEGTDWVIL